MELECKGSDRHLEFSKTLNFNGVCCVEPIRVIAPNFVKIGRVKNSKRLTFSVLTTKALQGFLQEEGMRQTAS